MEPVYFVLAILGCGDAGEACREVRTDPARYASEAQCRADLIPALTRNTDLSFPELEGRCRPAAPRLATVGRRPRG